MGYFRRLRKTRVTAEQCRKRCDEILARMCGPVPNKMQAEKLAEEWAAHRELLARYENRNTSKLDD